MEILTKLLVLLSLLGWTTVTSFQSPRGLVAIKTCARMRCVPLHSASNQDIPKSESNKAQSTVPTSDSKKLAKRWATGLSLGAIGTAWIFSGNGFFTLGFLLASLVALNEYYAMVKAAGAKCETDLVAPAAKTGTVASLACYITGK